ncbi:1-(5-phosphoribosyl)-5-[(5-phosphoribosylamino)methylideneamino]imidazole-4-carboxamide isomerase [Buchnera aphidicola]|uniref:1-(5-phosphoribosyl)-5-[(5- phosphoribosylamino)methylideneamino]imidazole-4- carboxamide isomerase n=1 Tax=Buchnera aphidicola TaxID=9 RepID=UPI0031B88606
MIIPSLDFINGKIVRLYKGNYNKKKYYYNNVFETLSKYQSQGANFVHLVDLNGADNVKNKQNFFLKEILSSVKKINIQIGGGIRTQFDIDFLLESGAKRIVLSSLAINNKNFVKKIFTIYGSECIVLALDVKINKKKKKEIYINGWKINTKILLEDIIEYYLSFGLRYLLCTDISKDGTLLGPNINLYKEILKKYPKIHLQSSGGVSNINDIILLKKIGVNDIIIGKALLEEKFSFIEANLC